MKKENNEKKENKENNIIKVIPIILILLLTLIFILFYFIFLPYQKVKKKERLINIIKEYIKDEEYDTAKNLCEKLLSDNVNDEEVNRLLAEIIAEINKIKENEKKERDELIKLFISLLKNRQPVQVTYIKDDTPKTRDIIKYVYNEGSDTESIHAANPDVEKLIMEGISHYRRNEYYMAKEKFKTALKIEKDNALANAYLGASIFDENPENADNYEEIASRCKSALAKDESIEIAHFTLAKLYYARGLFDQALTEYNITIKINPNNYLASYSAGKICFDTGKFDEAKMYFKNSTDAKKDFSNGYYYMGKTEYALKNNSEAIKELKKAISLDPDFSKSYILLSQIYKEESDLSNAIIFLEKANQIEKNYKNYYELALLFENIGQPDRAIGNYNSCILYNPRINDLEMDILFNCYERIINIYYGNSKLYDAANYCNKAKEDLKDYSYKIYQMSGAINAVLKKYDDAAADYLKAIEMDKNNYTLYYELGKVYKENKNILKAVSTYEEALRIKPDFYDAYLELAEIYFNQKKYKEAKDNLDIIKKNKPDYKNMDRVDLLLSKMGSE